MTERNFEMSVADVIREGENAYWFGMPTAQLPYVEGSYEYDLWQRGYSHAQELDYEDYNAMVAARQVFVE